MLSIHDLLFRLMLVVLIGGLIGAEREYRSKSAGFRTMILICLGSFLFTVFSIYITRDSPDRIASNIVTGIGFLGGGVIFHSQSRVNGITTAATIWATAALGMGIGAGYFHAVLLGTAIVLIALLLLTKLEVYIDRTNQSRTYRIITSYREDLFESYEKQMEDNGLRFQRMEQNKKNENICGTWLVHGPEQNHKQFVHAILRDSTVKEFDF